MLWQRAGAGVGTAGVSMGLVEIVVKFGKRSMAQHTGGGA